MKTKSQTNERWVGWKRGGGDESHIQYVLPLASIHASDSCWTSEVERPWISAVSWREWPFCCGMDILEKDGRRGEKTMLEKMATLMLKLGGR